MKTNRLNLVLILTSMTLLGACAEEEKKENLAMTDKKEQIQQNSEDLPKELVAEPVTQAEAVEADAKGEVTMKGSIFYKDLEGGFYAFIVEVKGTPKPDLMTFTQFGTVLQVTSVKVLDTSKVIDSLPTK